MINKFISGLSAHERRILTIAGVIVLLALFDVLLLRPSMSRLREIDERIQGEEIKIRQDMQFLAYKDRIVKEAQAFKDLYTGEVRTEEEVIAEFLKKIEGFASKSNIELTKVSPSGKEDQANYIKYLVSISCSGTMEGLTEFVYTINHSFGLLKVEKMDLVGNARDVEKVQANLLVAKIILPMDPSVDPKTLVKVKEEAPAQNP